MEHYDVATYDKNSKRMELLEDRFVKSMLIYAKKIASDRDFCHTGILDRNDVTQEAYKEVLEALNRIDWDKMRELPEEEMKAHVWAYVKKSFKLRLENRINILKDPIRSVKMNGMPYDVEEEDHIDLVFVPEYFDTDVPFDYDVNLDGISSYQNERLGVALEKVMGEHLDYNEVRVLNRSFGLDMDKMTMKEIAADLGFSIRKVERIKKSALERMRTTECKEALQLAFLE